MIQRYGGRVSCCPVIQPRRSQVNSVGTGIAISRARVASHHSSGLRHHRPGDPAAAADLLLQGLGTAMLAGGASMQARVLASLATTAAPAGDLPLVAAPSPPSLPPARPPP